MYVKIPQPSLSKINDEKIGEILSNKKTYELLMDEFAKVNSPRYKSWGDDLKYKKTYFENLTPEEFFLIIQFLRKVSSSKSPIKTEAGHIFTWQELDRFKKFFHQFSKDFGERKTVQLSEMKKEILRKKNYEGIIEEAIASSQIEGAAVTRERGRALLKSSKQPESLGEQMILNNYKTIQSIETEWKEEKMSLELLLKIQKKLTAKTLKKEDHEGRFRTKDDAIVVGSDITEDIAFEPPSDKFVKKELNNFIKFANEEPPFDNFMWDISRAIILHFWLAYLHPFCDGNGRTARAVFYWYLLRKNFLYIGFLPVSVRIRQSKTSYEKAFLLTEQDDNNLTYFFDYIVRQLELSIKDFYKFEESQKQSYEQKMEIENRFVKMNLNKRQIALIYYFIKNPHTFITFGIHENYHKITYVTARKDLLHLEELGFLISQKRSKTVRFYPTDKIQEAF